MRPIHVLYDRDCGVCARAADLVRAWDRRGRTIVATIQASDHLLGPIPAAERLASMHVVEADGRVWSGGAALTRLASVLPGGRPFAALGRAMPACTDALYLRAAERRGTLSRWFGAVACDTGEVDAAAATPPG